MKSGNHHYMHKTKYKEKTRKDNSALELSSVDHNHRAAKTSTFSVCMLPQSRRNMTAERSRARLTGAASLPAHGGYEGERQFGSKT